MSRQEGYGVKKRIKIILLVLASLILLFALAVGASALYSAKALIVTNYELAAPVQERLRIVQMSDLHSRSFGKNNQRLIEKVRGLEPDLIVLTGDMIDRSDPDPEALRELLRALGETAPVYYGYGNHERVWKNAAGDDLRTGIESSGAVVLESEYVDLTMKGCEMRIGGYSNYFRQPHMLTSDKEMIAAERLFADEFEDTERYKILLCHIPTSWLDWGGRDRNDTDLVLCGHYHGGSVRFPWGGALYAPYVGWDPPYTKGLFAGERATVILTTGLASEPDYPRINNPGEIVCLDLLPEK